MHRAWLLICLGLIACSGGGPGDAAGVHGLTDAQVRQVCARFDSLEGATIDTQSAEVVRLGRERGICPESDREIVELKPGAYASLTRGQVQVACDAAEELVENNQWLGPSIGLVAQAGVKQGICVGGKHAAEYQVLELDDGFFPALSVGQIKSQCNVAELLWREGKRPHPKQDPMLNAAYEQRICEQPPDF